MVTESSPYRAHSWCHRSRRGRNRLRARGHRSCRAGTGISGCRIPRRNQGHKLQETSRDVTRALAAEVSNPSSQPQLRVWRDAQQQAECALNKEQGLECLTPSRLWTLQLQLNSHCQNRAAHGVAFPFPAPSQAGSCWEVVPTPLSLAVKKQWSSSQYLPSLQLLPVQPASHRHPAMQTHGTGITDNKKHLETART